MNPINQSIKYLLLHSKIFLVTLSVYFLFIAMILLVTKTAEIKSTIMILQGSIFLGVYLGGGLTSLKKSYLWKNNTKYKNSVLNAFFLIILIISIVLAYLLFHTLAATKLVLLMPFCVSVFAAQMVVGKNIFYKIFVSAIPIILLYFLNQYGFDLSTILLIITSCTVILIIVMYKNIFYSFGVNKGVENKSSANTVAFMTTGLNSTQLNSINYKVGLITEKWVNSSKKTIDWAILMPHTRLTLFAIFYSLVFVALIILSGEKIKILGQGYFLMVLPMIILSIIVESTNLIRQTKTFSHIYHGANHRQLKNTILKALDKNISINTLVLILGMFIIVNVFSIAIFSKIMLASYVYIFLFTLSLYPLLLCLNWINISIRLIAIMFSYAFILYQGVKWITVNISTALTLPYILGFIVTCLILRAISQYIFWNKSLETLLKNN